MRNEESLKWRIFKDGCYIRVSTHIAGLAAKPKDVLDTLDLTNFGVKLFLYIGVRSVTIKDFATLQRESLKAGNL